MKQYRDGDVTIKKLMMTSLDGKRSLDVSGQVVSLNIFESIVQPVVLADFSFIDGLGIRQSFPMIGEEIIEIEFETPTLTLVKYKFYTYNIRDISIETNNKSQSYVVEAASKELITNATRTVNERFNQPISKTIKTIVSEYLKTNKKITVDTTLGIDNHLISQLRPLQAIDKLRQRAVSSQFKSSSFVFYEDMEGFHFTTLEKMIKDAKDAKIEWTYSDSFQRDVQKENRFRKMINYSPIQIVDTINKIQYGGTKNVIKHFDIITGETREFTYDDSESPFDTSGKQGRDQTSSFTKEFGQTTGVTRMFTINDDQSDHLLEKTSQLPGFVNRINQNIVHAVIHGDSSLRLGTPIKCTVTTATGTTEKEKTESNNYVVSKIRHMILNGARPVYTQSCELIGNSYDDS